MHGAAAVRSRQGCIAGPQTAERGAWCASEGCWEGPGVWDRCRFVFQEEGQVSGGGRYWLLRRLAPHLGQSSGFDGMRGQGSQVEATPILAFLTAYPFPHQLSPNKQVLTQPYSGKALDLSCCHPR